MIGKAVAQFLAFQKQPLPPTAVVGQLRLGVSLAGASHPTAACLSTNRQSR